MNGALRRGATGQLGATWQRHEARMLVLKMEEVWAAKVGTTYLQIHRTGPVSSLAWGRDGGLAQEPFTHLADANVDEASG